MSHVGGTVKAHLTELRKRSHKPVRREIALALQFHKELWHFDPEGARRTVRSQRHETTPHHHDSRPVGRMWQEMLLLESVLF